MSRVTPRRSRARSASALVSLLVLTLVMGVAVAGVALPAVGGLSLIVKSGSNAFLNLPSTLDVTGINSPSRMVDANGNTLATFFSQDRIFTPITRIDPVMQQAIVDIEDFRFYEHHGLDWHGVLRALVHNSSSSSTQGASTITQQFVKNVLLETATTPAEQQAAISDTLTRKIREARYAVALERKWTKKQILQGYLNIAYFGDQAYGIGAAAEHYFSETPSQLTLPQAALLAGLVQSPSYYDPVYNPKAAKVRRDTVIERMYQLGHISLAAETAAIHTPIRLHLTALRSGCVNSEYPYFCDYVYNELLNDPTLGATPVERAARLNSGGLIIHTTLNPSYQAEAVSTVDQYVPSDSKWGTALVTVQPGTGYVLNMAVNKLYDNKPGLQYTEENLATGGGTGFQAGSTFKVFVLTAAIEQGLPLTTGLHCPGVYYSQLGGPFAGYGPGTKGVSNAGGEGEAGYFNYAAALAQSVNTCFIQIEERTGLAAPVALAQSMGLPGVPGNTLEQVASFTFGPFGVSPLQMAAAYATYAAHGVYCAPTGISSITGPGGKVLLTAPKVCKRVMPATVADTVTSAMEDVLINGTAGGLGLYGHPSAGKTGTTDSSSNVWFDGFTPQLSTAVWMADYTAPNTNPLTNVCLPSGCFAEVFGATIPAPMWHQFMTFAESGLPYAALPPPASEYAVATGNGIPNIAGMSPSAALAALQQAGLTGQISSTAVDSTEPAGTVASTSPAIGSQAPGNGVIIVYLSNGHAPPPTPSPTTEPSTSPSGHPTTSPSPTKTK